MAGLFYWTNSFPVKGSKVLKIHQNKSDKSDFGGKNLPVQFDERKLDLTKYKLRWKN